jgi:hypothetical protein
VFSPLKEKGVPQKPLKIQGKPRFEAGQRESGTPFAIKFFRYRSPKPKEDIQQSLSFS